MTSNIHQYLSVWHHRTDLFRLCSLLYRQSSRNSFFGRFAWFICWHSDDEVPSGLLCEFILSCLKRVFGHGVSGTLVSSQKFYEATVLPLYKQALGHGCYLFTLVMQQLWIFPLVYTLLLQCVSYGTEHLFDIKYCEHFFFVFYFKRIQWKA